MLIIGIILKKKPKNINDELSSFCIEFLSEKLK